MGIFINRGNTDFLSSLTGEYVDKSGLIAVVNRTLFTDQRFSCVTRCRRFGKSMAARMLCAYYDDSCDSRSLFAGLEIEHEASFEKHPNLEVAGEMESAVKRNNWKGVTEALKQSRRLLDATIAGDILLVGINYDTDTKQHTCKIERWTL